MTYIASRFSHGLFVLTLILFSIALCSHHVLYANSAPTVDTIVISESSGGPSVSSSINLVENSTKQLYVHGQYTDSDDCDDVKSGGSINLVFYRSGVTNGSDCSADNRNCYTAVTGGSGCTISNCTAGTSTVTGDYECTIAVQHYSDPTDSGTYAAEVWNAFIEATDTASANGSMSSSTEINSLVALQLSGNVAYGAMELGSTSTQQSIDIQNTGNVSIDADISATDMTCTVGTIAASQQHFSSSSGTPYNLMLPLSTSSQHQSLNLAQQQDANASTSSLYFMLQAPTSSLAGNCNGQLTLNAKLDS